MSYSGCGWCGPADGERKEADNAAAGQQEEQRGEIVSYVKLLNEEMARRPSSTALPAAATALMLPGDRGPRWRRYSLPDRVLLPGYLPIGPVAAALSAESGPVGTSHGR